MAIIGVAGTNMPGAFWANGRTYTLGSPTQCQTRGGMWGDFLVDDVSCGYKGRRLMGL